jgi:nucleotide-binding universal stress UspA family protein
MFENILLAFDGSPHSVRAAQTAAEIARCHPGLLRIVVTYDRIPAYLGEPNMQVIITAQLEDAETQMKKAQEIVGEIPGELSTEILEGPTAEAILQIAETRKCDLIVMGSRGLGSLAGLLLGSQSQKVVSHATCPVLIVR